MRQLGKGEAWGGKVSSGRYGVAWQLRNGRAWFGKVWYGLERRVKARFFNKTTSPGSIFTVLMQNYIQEFNEII